MGPEAHFLLRILGRCSRLHCASDAAHGRFDRCADETKGSNSSNRNECSNQCVLNNCGAFFFAAHFCDERLEFLHFNLQMVVVGLCRTITVYGKTSYWLGLPTWNCRGFVSACNRVRVKRVKYWLYVKFAGWLSSSVAYEKKGQAALFSTLGLGRCCRRHGTTDTTHGRLN